VPSDVKSKSIKLRLSESEHTHIVIGITHSFVNVCVRWLRKRQKYMTGL